MLIRNSWKSILWRIANNKSRKTYNDEKCKTASSDFRYFGFLLQSKTLCNRIWNKKLWCNEKWTHVRKLGINYIHANIQNISVLRHFMALHTEECITTSCDYWEFNPPLAGGSIPPSLLANFLNNSIARADIDAKVTIPYSASIWHPQTKFQRNPWRSVWENGV